MGQNADIQSQGSLYNQALMIVSASYRTDIPAFYADWFAHRLELGFAMVANPYGGKPYRVDLAGDKVDGFVFWTRNMEPFKANLATITDQGVPFMVQYTATGYPRALEPSVIASDRAVASIEGLANQYGPRVVVWRYDPIIYSDLTNADFHRRNFAQLASQLSGSVDEVCVSFAQIYSKTRRNMDLAAQNHDFTWSDPDWDIKQALLEDLQSTAADHHMRLTVCSQPDINAAPASCIDVARLSDIAGHIIKARQKGNRPGCLCAESRDIGAYDTCPHGCAYCYAVKDREKALANYRRHDTENELLVRT